MELILIIEGSFATPRSRTDITTSGKGEEFRIASRSSSELRIQVGRGSSPGHVLHLFLLALHTNLAADVSAYIRFPILFI